MADRIQFRRDTEARWSQFNPVLLEGEMGIVSDNPNKYKIGDGETAWNDLPFRGFDGTVVQETGNSETSVMSQKATTEACSKIEQILLNKTINISDFVTGRWVGSGSTISPDSQSGYIRNSEPFTVNGNSADLVSIYDKNGAKVRIASLNLTIKFNDSTDNNVEWSYENNGNDIQLSGNVTKLYIHLQTDYADSVDGCYFVGLGNITDDIQKNAESIENATQDIAQNTQDIATLNNTLVGGDVNYTTGAQLGVYPNHAYTGSTLGDNPVSNSTNSALGRIDVSSIEQGTLIYVTKDGENVFDGITYKFFDSSGNRLANTSGGSSSTNNRGYLVPSGAVTLGLHKSNSTIESDIESYLSNLHINNVPSSQQGFEERIAQNTQDIAQNTQDIAQNTQDIATLNNTVTELQDDIDNLSVSDYKNTLKILFIGSSFGVDTINEVGNICASFGKDVILGNAYIGAATLQTFINRYDSDSGVTYYKWKYKATKWQIYNGNTGEWADTDSNITDEGSNPNDSVLLPWLLADEAWDFIILQNGAYQSPYQDQSAFWTKGEDGVITNNIVQNMINRCKKSCLYSNPVFGMNMTWAFSVYHTVSESHGPSGANDDKWLSYGSNQKERQTGMWNNIATNYKACIENCEDVKFVIPSGTAVQNARVNSSLRQSTIYTSASPAPPTISQAEAITDLDNISSTYPFMNNSTNWANKTDFTRDSIHADFGITRYIIAATLFQTFIAKVLNLDIAECTYRIAQGNGNYREQLCTPVTDDNFSDIVNCVKNAISKPYEITQ